METNCGLSSGGVLHEEIEVVPSERERAGLPPVGRARELAVLDAALDEAREGSGGLVCAVGAPRIGTTRLAQEAVRRARSAAFTCASGCGWNEGGTPPLWPCPRSSSSSVKQGRMRRRARPTPSASPSSGR